MNVFERYAPFVQDFIYGQYWENLRAIQVAAGEAIFNSDENVLLTASTASGKTEAAFFPIITLLSENRPNSVGAIYIGPLKALINDQFLRLSKLCHDGHIPVWHWHGDVSQSHKHHLLEKPSGILQITPESLEALLLRRHMAIPKLFHDLRFVVIDEMHSLLRGERGGQTLCLLERIARLAKVNPRRIGLSATIGDPQNAGRFLSLGTHRQTIVPRIAPTGNRSRLSVAHFYIPFSDRPDQSPEANFDPGLRYVFEHTRSKKSLIFVNSREECEDVTSTLRQYCDCLHEPDRYLIHHGNLSASYREHAEECMLDDSKRMSTVTTSTLELGIDIGRLERAIQINAPWTVSSFLQRMGRTGRRDTPPEMLFVIREELPEPRTTLPETLPWNLIQTIALIQLYLEERWVEPTVLDPYPFSLLYHQTMSTLASEGELSPKALASRILTLPYFQKISQEDFKTLLLHLIETQHIQKTEQGGLIVGLAGERIINSYKFYSVFKENEEYTVRDASQELGTIVHPPPPGEKIAIAGHVWLVLDVDYKRHVVMCEKVKGKVSAYFGQCPGDVHSKILARMQKVLQEDVSYPYLLKKAQERLDEARETAALTHIDKQTLVNLGEDRWCFFPWLGTYAFMALERFLKNICAKQLGLKALDAAKPFFMQFSMQADAKTFFRVLLAESQKDFNPLQLIYPKEVPEFNKYDKYLPQDLIKKGFAFGILDIQGMRKQIAAWQA